MLFTGASRDSDQEFRVQQKLQNPKQAADLLEELNQMCLDIIASMEESYLGQPHKPEPEFDPNKAYKRAFRESPAYAKFPDRDARARMIVRNLKSRYDPSQLVENDPKGTRNTSYVLQKGQIMAICLRERQTGNKHLHELPILQFVTMHELAHIGTLDHGHNPSFWKNFKVILQEGSKAGYHLPDFSVTKPEQYCGITVSHNPYYSRVLRLHIENPNDI